VSGGRDPAAFAGLIPSPAGMWRGDMHEVGATTAGQPERPGSTAADEAQPEREHHYLSTGCLHGRHDYCQGTEGAAGPKVPNSCKFCRAPCICPCHHPGSTG
jgi:hypothetical protein